jgi:hypothetical protein
MLLVRGKQRYLEAFVESDISARPPDMFQGSFFNLMSLRETTGFILKQIETHLSSTTLEVVILTLLSILII